MRRCKSTKLCANTSKRGTELRRDSAQLGLNAELAKIHALIALA